MSIDYPKPEQEGELQRLWSLAFGDGPELIRGFFETGYQRDCCRCLRMDGRVAAGLYWFDGEMDGEKLAYLYAVATHPDFRNRGLCRALMEDTRQVLAGRGYTGILLTPAEPGLRRMYAGMGYEPCCTVSEQTYRASGEEVPLRPIGREEYGALRRGFLPKGGVIQEGRNLAYLETLTRFYAGEDFLLAGSEEGGAFRGVELLGNEKAGPGILAALGYEKGTFRTPGAEKPFAMFRPLTQNGKRPKYFGLAFD